MAESFAGYRITNPTTKAAPLLYTSRGLRATGVISNRPCNLVVLAGYNPGTEALFLQLHESEPRTGAVPAWMVAVPKRGSFSWVPAQGGRVFSRLHFAISSTPDTYTPAAVGFWLDAEGSTLG